MAVLTAFGAGISMRVAVAKATLVSAALLFGAMAAAQQPTLLPAEPIQQPNTLAWADQNRFLEIFAGQRQQDYREMDTQALTGSGILDSETGDQDHVGAALRWQTVHGWLLHLQAERQSGVTEYNGYLQAGNGSLIPYHARTGNIATQISVSFGYALNNTSWALLPLNWQITPLLQISQYRWVRNLVQYSETYDHTTRAIGALVQWQARPGTVLEAQAMVGRTQSATVSVPAFSFEAEQAGDALREWQVGIRQDLSAIAGTERFNGWRVVARYTGSQYGHGSSPVINGLQAPTSQHRPNTWALGLQKQF